MPDQQPQTLSIPSLLLLAAFAAVTIRYFFFPSSRQSANPSSSSLRRTVNPADVEQIATMFPQIGRREIMWDLQRNGGSVGATTERILSRGRLDTPPPSFQPPIAPAGVTPTTANSSSGQTKSEHINLITRYNLGSRISSSFSEDSGASGSAQTQTWSNNKNERQALLKKRREEMILNARRKLEEKERERLKQEG